MNQTQKEWIKIIALVIGSGSAVTVTSAVGGAKLWIAILCGLGTGMTNLYHAMSDKPGQSQDDQTPKP
jgi:pantothenate kinase type III